MIEWLTPGRMLALLIGLVIVFNGVTKVIRAIVNRPRPAGEAWLRVVKARIKHLDERIAEVEAELDGRLQRLEAQQLGDGPFRAASPQVRVEPRLVSTDTPPPDRDPIVVYEDGDVDKPVVINPTNGVAMSVAELREELEADYKSGAKGR